jgi:trans-AT polyketide synthase/acyltransferase/oxidoreductase domain-containing protein
MRVYGFPGQGSQTPGMGADLFDRFPEETRAADAMLGYSIRSLCQGDSDGRLMQTRYTQPAMYVVGALSYLRQALDDPGDPDFLIGHSLGEYVALFAAGAFDFETGLSLVQYRGQLMSEAPPGGMAAVVGVSRSVVVELLREAGVTSVDIANLNTRLQTVLAGPTEDVARLETLVIARGAAFIPLRVSAPFHSRYMFHAAEAFAQRLADVELGPLRTHVISNVFARPYRRGEERATLAKQILSPVDWVGSVRYLMREGPFSFVELGPGRVLTRLVQEITMGTPFEGAVGRSPATMTPEEAGPSRAAGTRPSGPSAPPTSAAAGEELS